MDLNNHSPRLRLIGSLHLSAAGLEAIAKLKRFKPIVLPGETAAQNYAPSPLSPAAAVVIIIICL
jgi:hypothetical protein